MARRERRDTESYFSDDRDRREHRRRHKHRSDSVERRERRERRRAEGARREAELDLDDLRARRTDYFSRPEEERRRTRDSRYMPEVVEVEAERPRTRSSRHRHDSGHGSSNHSRRKKRSKAADDRSEDHVYGRPEPRAEEVGVKRSTTRSRSDARISSRRSAEEGSSRPVSLRRAEEPNISRSMSAREPTRVYMSTRPSVRRSSTIKIAGDPVTRSASVSERPSNPRRRSAGLFTSLFRPAPPRVSTTVLQKEVPRVECVICMTDDLPSNKTAKLDCGHRMCYSCLKRQFTLSVKDPAHMPPTCCTTEHIPLKYVDRLFDDKFKKLWNTKYQEYTTANRLYCPTKGCGEWIKPSKIRMDLTYGRKYARCGRCDTKVCVHCNNKFHTKRDCPRDEETKRVVQMAKEQGWQRCYNCKTMVELKEGCNHMTCHCAAQFCMLCGARWKSCNCPWFNYTNLDEGDQLNDMRVPQVVEVIVDEDTRNPPLRRPSTRHQDRRDMERQDEALARALQDQMAFDDRDPTPTYRHRQHHRYHYDQAYAPPAAAAPPQVEVYGLGNAGSHHLNESYNMRPLSSTPRTVHRSAAAVPTVTRVTRSRTVRDLFGRPRQAAPPPGPAPASAQAGLTKDGGRRGQGGRVGIWLQHVEMDAEAVEGRGQGRLVEVDEWGGDLESVRGID